MQRGYRVLYEPAAPVYHLHDETWPQVRRRYFREGQAAKWIGLRSRRDTPSDVWRETGAFVADLGVAARARSFWSSAGEIARFRYEKTIGTLAGIWSGAAADNPTLREKLLFDRHYDAVVIRSQGEATLLKLEVPEIKPSEVLVRVAYEGICATDLEVLTGELGYYKQGLAKYPIVPGHEFSGTVAAAGARVTQFAIGDPVVVECIQGCGHCAACASDDAIACVDRQETGVWGRNGGYAQYVVASSRFVHRVPPAVSLRQASLCEPTAVVLKGLRRLSRATGADELNECVVIGAGAIGHLVAQVLASRGCAVTAIDRDAQRLMCFKDSRIRTSTNLESIASIRTIIEATGDPQVLDNVLQKSAAGSSILLLGFPYGRRPFSFEGIVAYDKIVVGSVGSASCDFQNALAVLPSLDTTALCDVTVPLTDFQRGWELHRHRRALKVMLEVDPPR